MIDAASGGALGDMTPAEARNLIEKMASNSQQFSARNDAIVIRGVHEVATNSSASSETKKLEGKLDALVNLVTQLALNQKFVTVARVCGLCSSADHHTDLCPSMQQPGAIEQPEAYAANIYNRPPQPQQQNQPQQSNYDLSSNRYNPGWRTHPNLRWSMLQIFTIDLLNLSSKINHSRAIMTFPATDTTLDGGLTLTSDGPALSNNHSSLLLPSKMLLAQADHTFLHQSNNSNNPRNSQQLRPLHNLPLKNL